MSEEDFIATEEMKGFPLCMPFTCLNIPIVDDSVLEKSESFIVAVSLDRRAIANNITLNQTSVEVVIEDNEESKKMQCIIITTAHKKNSLCIYLVTVFVGLEKSVHLVSESSQTVEVCAVLNTTHTDCVVGFPFEISLSLDGKG